MTISPSKDCWSRYDIDTNFRVLAEWLGPDVPRAMTLPELQWLSGAQEYRVPNRGVVDPRQSRQGSRPDVPPTPLTGCSHFVLMAQEVSRRECLAMFEKIRGRDHSPG